MQIWIDIDNEKHIPFYKALITELNKRGHQVTVTALDTKEIKAVLKEYKINAKVIGKIFSLFGLFEKFSEISRAILLKSYITPRRINLALSLGSKAMLTTCVSLDLPLVILLYNQAQKIHKYHFVFKKSYYIISDVIPEELFVKYFITPERIRKYKEIEDNKETPCFLYHSLTEICDQLDSLSNCISSEINA